MKPLNPKIMEQSKSLSPEEIQEVLEEMRI